MANIAVIIPYFQRKPGILQRALASVLRQKLPEGVRVQIVVVDDESPLPARSETDALQFPSPFQLTLVTQPNGGVGSARNAGLANIAKNTTYVAFLDSDDIWDENHLNQAIAVLNTGYDFYFCDNKQIDSNVTYFSTKSFEHFLSSKNAHPIGEDFYALEKYSFFDLSLRGRVALIPTVVFRHSSAPSLKFETLLRTAGEDCLFIFQLLDLCDRICCSKQVLVTIADGINIHAGKFSWDDSGHLIQCMGQLLAFYEWRRQLTLSASNDHFMLERIKKVRKLFAFLTIRYALKHRKFWPAELIDMTLRDSRFWLWYPFNIFFVIVCYPLKFYNPLTKW